eukprot:8486230-Lingulodinium_polyedra.AAC.1
MKACGRANARSKPPAPTSRAKRRAVAACAMTVMARKKLRAPLRSFWNHSGHLCRHAIGESAL